MGAVLGLGTSSLACCAEQLACCALSTICSTLTSCICRTLCCGSGSEGNSSAAVAKVCYLGYMVLSCMFALIMQNGGAEDINLLAWKVNCDPHKPEQASGSSWSLTGLTHYQKEYYLACKGEAAVYRVSLMTALFFLIMMIGTAIDTRWHVHMWTQKTFLWLALMVSSIFVPNSWVDGGGYAWLARVVSFVFLLVQIVMLIDFAYSWNEAWVDKASEDLFGDGKQWLYGLLGASVLLYAGAVAGIGYLYAAFSACGLAAFLTSATLFLVIALTAVQLLGEEGALLPSAVVSAYAVYLCWNGIASNPELDPATATCGGHTPNAISDADAAGLRAWASTVHVWVGLCLATFSLAWSTFSTAEALPSFLSSAVQGEAPSSSNIAGSSRQAREDAAQELKEVLVGANDNEGASIGSSAHATDIKSDISDMDRAAENEFRAQAQGYHFVMLAGALYMSMLLTDWGTRTTGGDGGSAKTAVEMTGGVTAMWVKVVSQWLAVALYVWTLVAHKVCPDRDFF